MRAALASSASSYIDIKDRLGNAATCNPPSAVYARQNVRRMRIIDEDDAIDAEQ